MLLNQALYCTISVVQILLSDYHFTWLQLSSGCPKFGIAPTGQKTSCTEQNNLVQFWTFMFFLFGSTLNSFQGWNIKKLFTFLIHIQCLYRCVIGGVFSQTGWLLCWCKAIRMWRWFSLGLSVCWRHMVFTPTPEICHVNKILY